MPTWSETFQPISLLVLGWLFGILSPAIVEHIKTRRRTAALSRALALELQELRYDMAAKAYLLRNKLLMLDDAFLDWYEANLAAYKGPQPVDKYIALIRMKRSLPLPLRSQHNPATGLFLNDAEAPLLGVHKNELLQFKLSEQAALLTILTGVSRFNALVANANGQASKTFEVSSDDDLESLKGNILSVYATLSAIAVRTADSVKSLPRSLSIK